VNKSATYLLIGLCLSLIAGFSALLLLDHQMAERFANVSADQSMATFLAKVGPPHAKSDCESAERPITRAHSEAIARLQNGVPRHCKQIWVYRTYLPGDGWIVAIDEQDVVMQIDRKALP
jgi:hypothetical protein